jgi:hypothetical protein
VRVHDRRVRVALFGAVFTPAARRGRGHATAMVQAALDEARARGDAAALLYSDIGTAYYRRLGFSPLPADEHWGRLPQSSGRAAAGWSLRPMREADLATLVAAYDATSARRPLATIRDLEHWSFLRQRADGFFACLRDGSLLQLCRIATRAGADVGYLVTVEGRGEWNVREVGAVDGEERTIEQILRLGARAAKERGLRRVYGWLPPEVVPLLADWGLRTRRRRRALPMILPFDDRVATAALVEASRFHLTFKDQF